VSDGQLRRLEIGPGSEPIPGFESLNIVNDGFSDYVQNASGRLPFEEGAFDLIYASHILEHVPWTHTGETLKEWRRILKDGGSLEVWVPDGLKICRKFVETEESQEPFVAPDGWYRLNPERDPCVWANGRIFTYGDEQGTLAHWNWHFALFSPRYLEKLLLKAGFSEVRRMSNAEVRGYDHGWINLGMRATK
jgi:predicted SAM-dependent methyltransferase